MIHARRWQWAWGTAVALSALLSWSGLAKAQYSVNYAEIKIYEKWQDGDRTAWETIRTNDILRDALGLDPDERIPSWARLVVTPDCGPPIPEVYVEVYDREAGEIVQTLFELYIISATYDENSRGDLTETYVFGMEAPDDGIEGPFAFAGRTRMRFESEVSDYCWGSGRVNIMGAYAPDDLFDGAWIKWGNAKDFSGLMMAVE